MKDGHFLSSSRKPLIDDSLILYPVYRVATVWRWDW